jgi:hypothetical protein
VEPVAGYPDAFLAARAVDGDYAALELDGTTAQQQMEHVDLAHAGVGLVAPDLDPAVREVLVAAEQRTGSGLTAQSQRSTRTVQPKKNPRFP